MLLSACGAAPRERRNNGTGIQGTRGGRRGDSGNYPGARSGRDRSSHDASHQRSVRPVRGYVHGGNHRARSGQAGRRRQGGKISHGHRQHLSPDRHQDFSADLPAGAARRPRARREVRRRGPRIGGERPVRRHPAQRRTQASDHPVARHRSTETDVLQEREGQAQPRR